MNLCPPPHLFFPFGTEPIIFDTLLFVREARQIRGLEVGRPCLAERGLGVETHCFVLCGFCGVVCMWGTHRMFFRMLHVTINVDVIVDYGFGM